MNELKQEQTRNKQRVYAYSSKCVYSYYQPENLIEKKKNSWRRDGSAPRFINNKNGTSYFDTKP